MSASVRPFMRSDQTFETIGRAAEQPAFGGVGRSWWLALAASLGLVGMLVVSVGWLFFEGVGVWGNNVPVTWALDIVGYDWWIGVATGAFGISVLLQMTGQGWRSGFSRLAETIAVLAAAAAAIYPIIHLGRPWFFYWNLPYPNTMLLWPQFRSPLFWDAVDILAYLTVSLSFWYVGMLPDLASLRDRAVGRSQAGTSHRFVHRFAQIYGIAALGWRGSATQWRLWAQALRAIGLLGLVTVVSLQTGAAVMFAGTLEPGWHDTIEPVAFLVAALFSGVGAISVLTVVVRGAFGLESLITEAHLDRLGRLLLGLGLLDLFCTATQTLFPLVDGDHFELLALGQRLHGPHAWAFWVMLGSGLVTVQLLWLSAARQSPVLLLLIGGAVCLGSWADHFMVIVDTLQHDFLPSADHGYSIGLWGMATFLGSCGLFLFLLLLGLRLLPILSLAQLRELSHAGAEATRTPVASDRLDAPKDAPLWGIAAEYDEAEPMIRAASSLGRCKLGRLELYSPLELPGAERALGLSRRHVSPMTLVGVAVGGASMMGMCVYATAYDYVFDIGGRPLVSWPAFVVPTVSFAMLVGTLATVATLLFQARLPRLNHPAFNIPGIGGATSDRYFLVVEKQHETFNAAVVERAIASLPDRPLAVHRVGR